MQEDARARSMLVIEAGRSEQHYWRDLWRYRELFYFLAWRDVLVRYKQTAIGVLWALIRPLVTIVVFTVVFGNLAKLPSGGVPYSVLVCAAMLPWQFFATAFTDVGNSLVGNAALISKTYFPRLLVPASTIAVAFIDFLISFVMLAALMAWYGLFPDWRILALPIFALMAGATALGLGLWIAALNVRYRDFRFLIPFLVQIGLFASPVGFSSNVVPEQWRVLYFMNPMVAVIDGFRWSVLSGRVQLNWVGLMVSTLLVSALLVGGVVYFRRTERTFVDVI